MISNGSIVFSENHFVRIQSCFVQHYNTCDVYRRFCDNVGFSPASLERLEDIAEIPLIPTQMFKSCDILSVPAESIVKICTSSGTNGSISRVFRDAKSLQSFTMGTAQRVTENLSNKASEFSMLCLGPQKDEAKDLWIAYIMSLMGGITAKQSYYVRDNKFLLMDLIEDLKSAGQSQEKVALIGPPMFFVYLFGALKNANTKLRLHPESFVITMGGWKKDEDKALSRSEIEENILDVLGLASTQFRDGYGAVELNTVVFDCVNKHMHLPDWTVAIAKDPDTLRPLHYGEEGILSFIDTSASSYPCFILTEDFGTVYPGGLCGCGVSGDYIAVSRRINKVESKGCALKMNNTEVVSA